MSFPSTLAGVALGVALLVSPGTRIAAAANAEDASAAANAANAAYAANAADAAAVADAAAANDAVPCPDSVASVVARAAADRDDACRGARAAIDFFRSLGKEATEPPVLEITSAIPAEAGETAVGCYIAQRKRIYMLPYRDFLRQRTWFSVPIDREMYRSLAAHETSHALAACHFAIERPTIQAHEYVAYVAMLSTMNPAVRARVLRANPGDGFQGEERITPLFYMFDPMRFGAEAYRHFLKPGVGTEFLQSVLGGKALLD